MAGRQVDGPSQQRMKQLREKPRTSHGCIRLPHLKEGLILILEEVARGARTGEGEAAQRSCTRKAIKAQRAESTSARPTTELTASQCTCKGRLVSGGGAGAGK